MVSAAYEAPKDEHAPACHVSVYLSNLTPNLAVFKTADEVENMFTIGELRKEP